MKILTCLALVLVLCLAACGKKGDPVPQDQKNWFSWEESRAMLTANGCLAIAAQMKGATQNVDSFSLEIEPLAPLPDSTLPPELQTDQNTCEGCPFTPRETAEITPTEEQPNEQGERYTFTYCPEKKAAGYRWRLVARSVFLAYPYQLTPVQTVR